MMIDDSIPRAIIQRDKKSYAIVPKIPVGIITPEQLDRISAVAKKYDIPAIKITSGQRIALVGIEKDKLEDIWHELDMPRGQVKPGERSLHYVQACPGIAACKYGVQDAIGMGQEMDKVFSDINLPAKVKVGISGCSFSCGESMVRDIGLLGKKSGWSLVIGGNAARRPRIGDIVAERLSKEQVIALTQRFLDFYGLYGKEKERTARFCERLGLEKIQQAILNENEWLNHSANYEEWDTD
ncbi:MAG: NAD(P)H-nitrite reductase large subunit [Oleispira sp.]|jgi:NAD(P)H-nitrite reductase large subunit